MTYDTTELFIRKRALKRRLDELVLHATRKGYGADPDILNEIDDINVVLPLFGEIATYRQNIMNGFEVTESRKKIAAIKLRLKNNANQHANTFNDETEIDNG